MIRRDSKSFIATPVTITLVTIKKISRVMSPWKAPVQVAGSKTKSK